MDKVPFFSVCIPTYNRAHLLSAAIDSVLAQDFEDYELVIVDNASTDHTQEVLKQYNDPRIRIFRNSNTVSMYANHNKCIEFARAEWIVFLHSDDYFLPSTLFGFKDAIGKSNKSTKVFIARTPSLAYTNEYHEFGGIKALINFLRDGFSVPTGNVFSKSLFVESKVDFDTKEMFSDALFLLRIALESNARFETVPFVTKIWGWSGTSGQLFSSYGHINAWNRLAHYLKERIEIDTDLLKLLASSMAIWSPDQVTHLLFRFSCIGWFSTVDYIESFLVNKEVKFKSGRYYKHVFLIRLVGIQGHQFLYSSIKVFQNTLGYLRNWLRYFNRPYAMRK